MKYYIFTSLTCLSVCFSLNSIEASSLSEKPTEDLLHSESTRKTFSRGYSSNSDFNLRFIETDPPLTDELRLTDGLHLNKDKKSKRRSLSLERIVRSSSHEHIKEAQLQQKQKTMPIFLESDEKNGESFQNPQDTVTLDKPETMLDVIATNENAAHSFEKILSLDAFPESILNLHLITSHEDSFSGSV